MRFMRLLLLVSAFVVSLAFFQARSAQPVLAAHHLSEISEVMSGFSGDPDVQYVEINQRSLGQNIVNDTRLTVFNANGTFNAVLLLVPGNVAISGNGSKWLMGTTAFEAAAGISADFTFAPGILPNAGMVCWGAPGVSSSLPPSTMWDATVPSNYVDCVSYGGTAFTGVNPMSANPSSFGAGDGSSSLTRTVSATFNFSAPWAKSNDATDFALQSPSPTNNAGQVGSLTAVGGIAELPEVSGAPLEAPDSSGGNTGLLAAVIAAATAAMLTLAGAAWYARRRWLL